jgi:hypothetical protein
METFRNYCTTFSTAAKLFINGWLWRTRRWGDQKRGRSKLQQLAEFLDRQPGVLHNPAHCEGLDRIMPSGTVTWRVPSLITICLPCRTI